MKFGLMETLERRTLLSNVQAGDFGAVANDGRDDRQAVQPRWTT